MTAYAYYNEHDAYAAQWLRNLIAAGHIAPGFVDERSIEDVNPDDLRDFTQCHFFAGVGVWSYALRLAGWPDDRPIWTGSCPCQPFSQAGAGAGFDDKRHLWPHFAWLIWQRDPPVVFGEQVASKDAEPWVDAVQADLEALGYAFGAVPFPSAGIGAPHIRDRLYWVADGDSGVSGQGGPDLRGGFAGSDAQPWAGLGGDDDAGPQRRQVGAPGEGQRIALPGRSVGLANTERRQSAEPAGQWDGPGETAGTGPADRIAGCGAVPTPQSAGPVNGFWADADWLFCRDGKWRPVRPGSFPLANGAASRVGRLRAYGNAVNAYQAAEFIAAYLDSTARAS